MLVHTWYEESTPQSVNQNNISKLIPFALFIKGEG